jgi:hypothetical protein
MDTEENYALNRAFAAYEAALEEYAAVKGELIHTEKQVRLAANALRKIVFETRK